MLLFLHLLILGACAVSKHLKVLSSRNEPMPHTKLWGEEPNATSPLPSQCCDYPRPHKSLDWWHPSQSCPPGGMAAGNQAYLFYSRDMRSRLSREIPRSPREQSISRIQELCCEERNSGYIFQQRHHRSDGTFHTASKSVVIKGDYILSFMDSTVFSSFSK